MNKSIVETEDRIIKSIDKNNVYEIFYNLSKNLKEEKEKIVLTLFGGVVCVLFDHPSRFTIDIDVWKPLSKIENYSVLKKACYKSHLGFNVESDEIASIQITDHGIAEVGEVNEKDCIEVYKTENLLVRVIPPRNVIASKLIRASERDIEDCVFLIRKFRILPEEIKDVIKTFKHKMNREVALENFIYLEMSHAFDNTPYYQIRERVKKKLLKNKTAEGFRDKYVSAVSFLLSDKSPAELLLKKDYSTYKNLIEYIREGQPDFTLALHDPVMYKKLRKRVTDLICEGWI